MEQDRVEAAQAIGVHQHRRRRLIDEAWLDSDGPQHRFERVAREGMAAGSHEDVEHPVAAHRGLAALAMRLAWASVGRNDRSWAWPTRD